MKHSWNIKSGYDHLYFRFFLNLCTYKCIIGNIKRIMTQLAYFGISNENIQILNHLFVTARIFILLLLIIII